MIDQNFEIKTKRLIIRLYKESDFELWREALSSTPKQKNKWDNGPADLKELTKAKFNKILSTQKKLREKDEFYDFVAFEKKTGNLIGFCSVMDVSRGVFLNGYLGYRVFSQYWGKGYGKELVKETCSISFKYLKLHRLEAGIEPSNKRSIALAKASGFRREGLSKKRLFLNGEWLDMAIYAITSEDLGIKGAKGIIVQNRR